MKFDAFISYSSKDKTAADAACAVLESAGVRCWIAPRDIRPGEEYGDALIEALDSAKVFVLIFSSNTDSSPHIRREVERAVSKSIPIIPFRIENVLPTKGMAFFVSAVHWLDAFTPPLEKHLTRLAEVVGRLVTPETSDEGKSERKLPPTIPLLGIKHRRFRLNRRQALTTGAAALVAAPALFEYASARGYSRSWKGHSEFVESLAISGDGKLAVSGGGNGLTFWELASGRAIRSITSDSYHSLAFAEGQTLIAAGPGSPVMWNALTGKQTGKIPLEGVRLIARMPSGSQLLCGEYGEPSEADNDKNLLSLWDIRSRTLVRTFDPVDGSIYSLAVSPDGQFAVTGDDKGRLSFWNVATGAISGYGSFGKDSDNAVAFLADGRAVALENGNLRFWDAAQSRPSRLLTPNPRYISIYKAAINRISVSPNGRNAVSAGPDLIYWDLVSGQEISRMSGFTNVRAMAISPDGKVLLAADSDYSFKVWELG